VEYNSFIRRAYQLRQPRLVNNPGKIVSLPFSVILIEFWEGNAGKITEDKI